LVLLEETPTDECEAPVTIGNCTKVEVKDDLIKLTKEGKAKHVLHCVGQDLRMSAGIAAKFAQSFPRPELPDGFVKQPGAIVSQPLESGTTIHHVMYKQSSFDKIHYAPEPYLEKMDKGFDGIVDLISTNQMTDVWMPRILSGCDRLPWSVTSRWLMEKLANCPHQVTLHVVSPPDAPPYQPAGPRQAETDAGHPALQQQPEPPAPSRGSKQHKASPASPHNTRSKKASSASQPF
jgi:hypothetical protein